MAECSSSNPVAAILSQAERTVEQRFVQQQRPAMNMVEGFAEQSSSDQWLPHPHRSLPGPINSLSLDWTREFKNHPAQHRKHDFRAFEQVYQSQHQQSPNWTQEFTSFAPPPQGFSQEWDKQFEQVHQAMARVAVDSHEPADSQLWKSEFEKYSPDIVDADHLADFNHVWDDFRHANGIDELPDDHDDFAAWNEHFGSVFPEGMGDPQASSLEYDPVMAEVPLYTFEQNNPFLSHPAPFEHALHLLETNASLSQTALAFEAAVQRDPASSVAWRHLGQVQAENEKEGPAIIAMQHCVQNNPNDLDCLMVHFHNIEFSCKLYQ